MPTPLETRLSTLAPLIHDPAAPGTGEPGGETHEVVSLLYPTPDIAGDSRKWGIAQKNILSRLDELREQGGKEEDRNTDQANNEGGGSRGLDGRALDRLRDWVHAMEPDTLPEGGFALFAEGDELSVHPLAVRPYPTLHQGTIFALPALVDAARQLDYWCVVLDVEEPRLFRVSNNQWADRTPKEGVRTLSGEMGQYEPMDAVTFHSSGRPHLGKAAHAAAKFHALGTSVTDLKSEEVERVLHDLAVAVRGVVQTDGLPVLLAGDPKRCGLFRAHFDEQHLVDDLHVAGDALELRELADRAREAMRAWDEARRREDIAETDPHTLVTNEDELLSAAREGRIEAVYLREEAAGLLHGDDERLKLDAVEDDGIETRSMIVTQAVRNGASLRLIPEGMDDQPMISARMRY